LKGVIMHVKHRRELCLGFMAVLLAGIWDLVLRICFGFRISDFEFSI